MGDMSEYTGINDFDDIGDPVKMEIDRRKIQKLIDKGVLETNDLANAPIIHMDGAISPRPSMTPHFGKIISVTCNTNGCGQVFKGMQEFEQHLAAGHML